MNLLAVSAVLAVMLIPLLRVDRPIVRPSLAAGSAAVEATVPVALLLRCVHAPVEISLTVEGKAVPLRGAGLERQGEALLPVRERAFELELQATWPPGTPGTMVEVRAAPDAMPEQQQNVWAEAGAADEILRFTWRSQP